MTTALQHSPADIVRQLLIEIGQGIDSTTTLGPAVNVPPDWSVFTSTEPSVPDNCLTTYDIDGSSDGRIMVSGEAPYHYGFQIRIRSMDHPTGYIKANQLRNALAESVYMSTVKIDSASYTVHAITSIGEIIAIGKDNPATKRSLFTLNAMLAMGFLT
jgi:hypothetical protein